MTPNTWSEAPANLIRGALMGATDVVPGVSGGTIALVLGIYTRLVATIRQGSIALGQAIRGDFKGATASLREVPWLFIIPLGVGIIGAILVLAGPIEHALENYPVPMAGLFLGLVAGSTYVAWRLLEQPSWRLAGIALVSAAVVFVVLGLGGSSTSEGLTSPPLWAYPVSAAIAVCAMILPGISGSFFLVMLGMYSAVLSAAADRDWAILALFALGAVVGLAVFSRFLHWALQHHYDLVMAILIGLMVGSLRILWPWPNGLESTALGAPSESVPLTVGLAVLACAVVLAFNAIATRLEHRTVAEEAADLRA